MQTHTRFYDEIFDFDYIDEDEDEDMGERLIDNQYYIGLPVLETHNVYSYEDYLLFASSVKINTFYKFPYQDIVKYLNSYRCIGPYKMIQPEVMKMKFVKSKYIVKVLLLCFAPTIVFFQIASRADILYQNMYIVLPLVFIRMQCTHFSLFYWRSARPSAT